MQVWNLLHAARWKHRMQKKSPKIAIWAPLHKFVGLYLCNWGTYRQSEKNLLAAICPPHVFTIWWTSAHYRMTSIDQFGAPLQISTAFASIGSVTARQSSSERQPNFVALNRGRHLCSGGRPSRWALAHISSSTLLERNRQPAVRLRVSHNEDVACRNHSSACLCQIHRDRKKVSLHNADRFSKFFYR